MKKILLPIGSAMILASCTTPPVLLPKLDLPVREQTTDVDLARPDSARAGLSVNDNPSPPEAPAKPAKAAPPVAPVQQADVTLNFDSLPLPDFVQAVYATALKKNISVDPAVMAKKDLVTLRSGKAMSPADAEASARMVLKSYGVAVIETGVLTRIVPDNSNTGYLPEIRRGRALPESPLPLRPVFQMVELQVVRNTEIASHIRTLFGDKLKLTEDPARNSILLAGNGDDVQAALEAIQVLDQPLLKGRNSIRITPASWSAEELTKKLTEILTQEGYSVGVGLSGGVQYPITLLPVAGVNSVIVFTQSKEIANHIVEWSKTLDKPSERSVGRSFFSYPVRNTDASRLAETIQQLLSGASTRAATGAGAAAQTNSTGANPTISPISSSNVVVDKPTNTIMFRATGEEYTDIIRLLRELDRTARQVLIEVTVAKVSLGTTTEIGVDWIFSRLNKSGLNVTQLGGNTAGAGTLSLGSFTGLSVVQLDGAGAPRAVLNALATEDRATILATPRLLARNGEPADLQVGSQVPVLTSQQTSSATGGSGLISTVQYRDTGTILHIKPVIHSSDQVDIDITQEISSAKNNSAGGISSPTIDKTSLATKLTLKHGATYVLGGLISNEVSKSDSGVPFLKDIPLIGNAFKKNTDTVTRSETLIVITPYIINDDGEARAMTEAIRNQLGKTAGESSTREAIPSTR